MNPDRVTWKGKGSPSTPRLPKCHLYPETVEILSLTQSKTHEISSEPYVVVLVQPWIIETKEVWCVFVSKRDSEASSKTHYLTACELGTQTSEMTFP